MDFINKSIGWVLNLCYSMTGTYLLALLVFAVFVKIILLPLGIKQHSNSLKQARLRPLEAAVVKKYNGKTDRNSQQKRQMEIQTIQQKGGYSQLAGCLPMLLQLPIIIIIYNVIRKPLSYICGFGKETLDAINNVATSLNHPTDEIALLSKMRENFAPYASIEGVSLDALPNFSLFGIDLAQTPKLGFNLLMIIPILTFVCTFFSSKLQRKLSYRSPAVSQSSDDDTKLSLTIMEFVMPLISTWITFGVPAAIGVYWIYQNLLSVLQQFIMVKIKPYPTFTEEDYKEAERVVLGKKKKNKRGANALKDPNRPRVPSLHHIDDDEYNAKVVKTEKKPEKGSSNGLLEGGKMKIYESDDEK